MPNDKADETILVETVGKCDVNICEVHIKIYRKYHRLKYQEKNETFIKCIGGIHKICIAYN